MTFEITETSNQIHKLRAKMETLLDENGTTPQEILAVSMELDKLVNKYCQMMFTLK